MTIQKATISILTASALLFSSPAHAAQQRLLIKSLDSNASGYFDIDCNYPIGAKRIQFKVKLQMRGPYPMNRLSYRIQLQNGQNHEENKLIPYDVQFEETVELFPPIRVKRPLFAGFLAKARGFRIIDKSPETYRIYTEQQDFIQCD